MTTMNITIDQVDEQMKRLQEIKMFLESVAMPSREPQLHKTEVEKPEMNLIIHEYWKDK
jgi:hypothetical protein